MWLSYSNPGENLSRIFKDPARSSWGPLRILLSIFMRIFGKSLKIFKILVKIFKDPSFSCQDLQGSLIFFPRSSRIFNFLSKIFKDLWFSCQDLQGSWKFLSRSSRIFDFLAKIFMGLLFSCQDPWRSCLDFQRTLH